MAQVLPPEFHQSRVRNPAERVVIDAMRNRLGPQWFLIPNLEFRWDAVDHEIDLVIVNADYGVAVLEVKGGRIGIRHGQWTRNGNPEEPDSQAKRNAYALRNLLRSVVPNLSLQIDWGIALPDATLIIGDVPAGMSRGQVVLRTDLDEPELMVESLFARRSPLVPSEVEAIISVLCPTTEFTYDGTTTDRLVREQMLSICEAQVEAVRQLDVHRRVLVSGRAGTGKTYLATRWAWSGLRNEGARVLLTCYNDPLGQKLREEFVDASSDEQDSSQITVGPFLRVMLELEGMPETDFPNTEDTQHWDVLVLAHIVRNWSLVTSRFDRIIVDEAQDFSPAWLGLLESLLDPEGDNQMFLMADDLQGIQNRGFTPPSRDTGWVHATLVTNVRNPRDIAVIVRRYLSGAGSTSTMPSSRSIETVTIDSDDDAVSAVKRMVSEQQKRGIPNSDILVIASSSRLRDRLRAELGFGRADDWLEGLVSCETPYRAKGLEYPLVVVVAGFDGFGELGLYVALTRVTARLGIIGSDALMRDLGLNASG